MRSRCGSGEIFLQRPLQLPIGRFASLAESVGGGAALDWPVAGQIANPLCDLLIVSAVAKARLGHKRQGFLGSRGERSHGAVSRNCVGIGKLPPPRFDRPRIAIGSAHDVAE